MKVFFFLLVSLSASPLSWETRPQNYFVVWNIGQGQWTTFIQNEDCLHFDTGGEKFPWQKLRQQCARKKNQVFLSHWDWDHIGAMKNKNKLSSEVCLARRPLGETSLHKQQILPAPCRESFKPEWEWQPHLPGPGEAKAKANANDLSQIFLTHGFLIPGDSTQKEEKIWATALPQTSVRVLVLGHHGSRTSTSDFLLDHLSQVKMGISSARWQRYRHPHAETVARLKRHHIALLRTEDWGHLWFEL